MARPTSSIVAFVLLALAAELSAAPPTGHRIREFPTSAGALGGIVAGPDGNLWFTETDANKIGRITLAGVITEFPIPSPGARPERIAAGADGNLWFTESANAAIARITPNGVITEFPLPQTGFARRPVTLAAGPDGNIWYTHVISRVGRISPVGSYAEFGVNYDYLFGVAAGPDGNVWFTVRGGGYESKICRVTPDGVITQSWAPGLTEPADIIAAPDGNLWFTQPASIGRITPAGVISTFNAFAGESITVGSDGNLWFTQPAPSIGRMTTSGVALPSIALPAGAAPPTVVTSGPEGNIWYVDSNGTIGRITLTKPRWRRE